ncbi:MAG: hypothetical protein DRJ40_06310 [Thermoprotei archaeon]|nr:MAG: hypothetical protein DRJ40_06310 [Thermoprotei archaeon]
MKLALKNFGPFKHTEINMSPFTIFIGPNAAGKSMLLYLIWTLYTVELKWDNLRALLHEHYEKLVRVSSPEEKSQVLYELYCTIYEELPHLLRDNLVNLLQDAFGTSLTELVTRGEDRADIIVASDKGPRVLKLTIQDEELSITTFDEGRDLLRNLIYFRWEDYPGGRGRVAVVDTKSGETLFETETFDIGARDHVVAELSGLIPVAFMYVFDYCPYVSTMLLPDGRAGILRLREALAHALFVTSWKYIYVNAVDREFFKNLIATERTPVTDKYSLELANLLEREFSVEFTCRGEKFTVIDLVTGVEMPIEKAPSGLREIAPLVLLLKYRGIRKVPYIVMIEEPETHLHPDAQSLIIRVLAALVKCGECKVVITTHSNVVLDEVDNLIALSKLSQNEKPKLGYLPFEGLKSYDVSIYLVKRGGIVEPLQITDEGIPETELDEVLRQIYNRHVKVRTYARTK